MLVMCELQGMRFGELYRVFPDAIVLGLSDKASGKAVLNPSSETLVGPNDSLIMMRPTSIPDDLYKPLLVPLPVSIGLSLAPLIPPLQCHSSAF